MGKTKKADKALCQKWGIPDFEDVSAYPETYDALILQHFEGIIKQGMVSKEQIESWAWWWEFLRRTQAYRGYWEQHKNKARMHFHSDFDFEGELPDPRKRFYEKDVFICSHLCKSAMQRMTGLNFITHQDDAKSIINLRVDLRKPLPLQFSRLLEEARKQQKLKYPQSANQRVTGKEEWHKFLRALDAKEIGAGFQKIGEIGGSKSESPDEVRSSGQKFYRSAVRNQKLILGIDNLDASDCEPLCRLDG